MTLDRASPKESLEACSQCSPCQRLPAALPTPCATGRHRQPLSHPLLLDKPLLLLLFFSLLKSSLSPYSPEEGTGRRKPGCWAGKAIHTSRSSSEWELVPGFPPHPATCMATEENTTTWLHSNPRNTSRLLQLRKKYQGRKGCVTQQKPKMLICNCKEEFCRCSGSLLVVFNSLLIL